MLKSWLSSKFQPYPIIYVSKESNLIFWSYFSVVKQLYFILPHNWWKFTRTSSYLYYPSPPNLGSIYLAIFPQLFFLDSGQRRYLWSKCYFGKSKWHETFWASSYHQIIGICQILAQLATLCEWHFKISNLDQSMQLQSNYIKPWSLYLQIPHHDSSSYPKPPRHLFWAVSLLCWPQ